MIERTSSFKVGDQSFLTLGEAQKYELQQLLGTGLPSEVLAHDSVANWILRNKVAILDILTMTPTSKPKARKVNGGTKKRTVITDAVTSVTSKSNVISNPLPQVIIDNANTLVNTP